MPGLHTEFLSFLRNFKFHDLQRARASKNVKNFSQPADVLKIREKQAAFFEANVNVLITDRPRSFPRVREVFRLLQICCTCDLRS